MYIVPFMQNIKINLNIFPCAISVFVQFHCTVMELGKLNLITGTIDLPILFLFNICLFPLLMGTNIYFSKNFGVTFYIHYGILKHKVDTSPIL